MLQSFSGPKSREFRPVQLNNTAKKYERRGTNFLAFGGQPLKDQVIEYQKADLSQYTAKSAEVPLKVNNLKDSPVLDNTFAKPGVFKFKYDEIANPVAYGDDYNMDFGGKDPTAIGYFQKPEREVAEYIKKDMKFTDRYNNLKPKQYGGEKMGGVTMSNINPLMAYKLYGYRESMDWNKDEDYVGALSMNVKKRKTENSTIVMDIDQQTCSQDSIRVNGECVPLNDSARYCSEGYTYVKGSGCQKSHSNSLSANVNLGLHKMGENQHGEAVCPLGWEYKDGQCQVIKKEFSTGAPTSESESACNYTLGVVLGVIVILGLGAIFASANKRDNSPSKPRI